MRKSSLPHHLAALWFADIAGYSERGAEDERGALQLVEILQALSRSTVQRYEGRVVKFFGDAVLAEFPSTEMAVRAAAVLSTAIFANSQPRLVARTIFASVFILATLLLTQTGIFTAMASMRQRESRQRSIQARWSSAMTSGVKSVGAKGSVSNVWVIGILKAWV